MEVTAWNNGAHHQSGAGYGVKIRVADRDEYFDPNEPNVIMQIADGPGPFPVNTAKASFWNERCRELIKQEIGVWLRDIGLAPWPYRQPPTLYLERQQDGIYLLSNEPLN